MVNYWIYTTDGKLIYSSSDEILDWSSVGIKYDEIDGKLVWLSAKFEFNSVYISSLYKGVRYKKDGRLERIIVVIKLNNADDELPQKYYKYIKKIQQETKSNNIIIDWGNEYGEYTTKPTAFNYVLLNLNDIIYNLEISGALSINIDELQYSKNPDDKIRYYSLYVFYKLYKRLRKEYLGVFSYYTPTNILVDVPVFAISSDGIDLGDVVKNIYDFGDFNSQYYYYERSNKKGHLKILKNFLNIDNIKNVVKNIKYIKHRRRRIAISTINLIIACVVITMLIVGASLYFVGDNKKYCEDANGLIGDLKNNIVPFIQNNELLNKSIMPFINQYNNDANTTNNISNNNTINTSNINNNISMSIPKIAYVNESITLNATNILNAINNKTIGQTEYYWEFGDGHNTTTKYPVVNYTYNKTGNYTITFKIPFINYTHVSNITIIKKNSVVKK